MYISKEDLNRKVEKFMQREPKYLKNYVDVHFEDEMIKLPMETAEGHLVEATFCEGYKHRKYLVALSAQAGCAAQCKFCDLGDYGLIKNLSPEEILDEINITLRKANQRDYSLDKKPLKLSFVMGGDALGNRYFGQAFDRIKNEVPLQTKISTIFPASNNAKAIYREIVDVAREYPNIIQFQISLNSTDKEYRQSLVKIPLASFEEIQKAGELWKEKVPNPRKIDLTFTINQETPLDPDDISKVLTPDLFAIRLRPWKPTQRGKNFGIEEILKDKYLETREKFIDAGFQDIPGAAGEVEHVFKLSAGEILKLYSQLRNNKTNSQKGSSGGK